MRRTTTWILLLGALVGVSLLVFQIAFEPSSEVDPTSSSTKGAEQPVADPALVGRPRPARPSTEPERGLTGVVHDETGRGVAGVRVVAMRTSSPTAPEPSPHALVFDRRHRSWVRATTYPAAPGPERPSSSSFGRIIHCVSVWSVPPERGSKPS